MSVWPRAKANSGLDEVASSLMQLVILTDPGKHKKREVASAQTAFMRLLLRHLNGRYGPEEARTRLQEGMKIVDRCRRARQVKERLWKEEEDQA